MTNNRLLPVRNGLCLTLGDVLLLEWPHMSMVRAEWLVWEVTGWPDFFVTSPAEPTHVHVLRRQMRDFVQWVNQAA